MITSSLDGISGIGPKKKKMLLTHFGSVRKLEQASIEDLQKVEGLSKKDISTLLEFIKSRRKDLIL
jgi:excinuclease ABC subunit C